MDFKMVKLILSGKRYMDKRKEMLLEMQRLVYERQKFNNDIRSLKKEMDAWDRAMILK